MLLLHRLAVLLFLATHSFTSSIVSALPVPQQLVPVDPRPVLPVTDGATSGRVIPIVNLPLATQITASETNGTIQGAVISSAFVYANDSNFYPGVRVPPGWSFSIGLLHPFVYPKGTDNDRPIYHSATLEDGSALPEWLVFDNETVTFNGFSPTVPGIQVCRIKLMGSDTYGNDDVAQGFNLTVGLHSLELRGDPLELNVTAGYPTTIPISTWSQIQLDGQSISPANITNIVIDDSTDGWIRFDQATRDIVVNPGTERIGRVYGIPVGIYDAFGDLLSTNLTVQVEPYAFTSNVTNPALLGRQDFIESGSYLPREALANLSGYLASADVSGLSFEMSIAESDLGQAVSLDASAGGLYLKGWLPETRGIVSVEVRATNTTSTAVSTLSFQLDLAQSAPDDKVAPKSGNIGAGARAALGAAVGIACLALILFLLYLFYKKPRGGDISMRSSLSMRQSVILGPETGIFSRPQRSSQYLNVDRTQDEVKRDEDTYSARTLVERNLSQESSDPMVPSSSSLIVRVSKSASTFSRRMMHAVFFGARFDKRRLSKDMISDPIEQAQVTDPNSMSSIPRAAPSAPDLPVLTREGLFEAVRSIGRRETSDSTSTVFTNFSHDTELWGKSDHEEESNFSQTPSHRRVRCLRGTSRSGGQMPHSPTSSESATTPEVSSSDSPTPRTLYPRDLVLNTINEDLGREGAVMLSPLRNPFQPTASENSSLGTVQTVSRGVFEAATEHIIVGCVRKTTYGSTALIDHHGEEAERSFIGSIGQSERSDGSAELGDKGSILLQTSFEGFQASDSVTADAEEVEQIRVGGASGQVHTSIAAESRSSQHSTGAVSQGRRMASSRRTGSHSSLAPATCIVLH